MKLKICFKGRRGNNHRCGEFDPDKKQVNIFHCEHIEGHIIGILVHEVTHQVILEYVGRAAAVKFDNIVDDIETFLQLQCPIEKAFM